MQLRLNRESAAVLLRCLAYGESSVSQIEVENGVAKIVQNNTQQLRRQVAKLMADSIIKEQADAA